MMMKYSNDTMLSNYKDDRELKASKEQLKSGEGSFRMIVWLRHGLAVTNEEKASIQ